MKKKLKKPGKYSSIHPVLKKIVNQLITTICAVWAVVYYQQLTLQNYEKKANF